MRSGAARRPAARRQYRAGGFARDLAANGAAVAQVDWRPPRDCRHSWTEKSTPHRDANAEALARILAGEPVLTDVRRAGELIPALDAERLMLHAGPPIDWERMCGPMRGAVCGAIVFEGWAADLAAAEKLAASGGVSSSRPTTTSARSAR